MAPDFAYETMLVFWRIVTNIFFREVRPRGAFNIPKDGPVIFVAAPHHNQFLDPLILLSEVHRECQRRVSFLIAAKSMKRKAVGTFASFMHSIPVRRAADDAKPGSGRIYISAEDPCTVYGINTRFTAELGAQCQLQLPKSLGFAAAEILEIHSDTRLRVKKEFGGESGKLTSKFLEKVKEQKEQGDEGVPYKILPHVNQQEMYQHVYNKLKEGGCVGIFPEGGSHDRTDLLPLKAGVAIMALGAMRANPGLQVKIVPVGLSYFHPDRFRSRAVVEFGHAMDVPSELVEMFGHGGAEKRQACGKLLDIIYDGLKTVTLRGPDYETLMVIQAGRRLYKTPGQHLTLSQVVELNKRFIEGYMHFKDEPRIIELRKNVMKYNRLVRDLGLRDHQVPRAQRAGWKNLGLLTYRLGLLIVWSVLALPGVILNGPIFLLASILSKKKAKEALAASTVKVAGRDVIATWKILISLGATPILYGFYAFIATMITIKAGAPLHWRIWTPFLVLIALPCIGFSALKFGEAGMDVLKSLRPLIVSLFPGQQKQLDRLKKMRNDLANEVSDVINEFGPRLYEDFDEWRILVPSASVPPSTGTPGLWRRKSGTGGVDAQGSLLVHPMTWLDERLFGWSRSAQRGTSVWAGGSSGLPSRVVSPEASDDEDTGDYDHVISILPAMEGGNASDVAGDAGSLKKASRSQRSSYADIQQARRAAAGVSGGLHGSGSPSEGPGISSRDRARSDVNLAHLAPVYHTRRSTPASPTKTTKQLPSQSPERVSGPDGRSLRKGPRERRASLTDRVYVERISHVNPVDPFKDATAEINRENSMLRLERGGHQMEDGEEKEEETK